MPSTRLGSLQWPRSPRAFRRGAKLPQGWEPAGNPQLPRKHREKGAKDMPGSKSPPFSYLPTPKSFQRKPPACSQPCARGAPSPPAPCSCGLWIASFCQFFAPYLTAEGRIKQSSQPDLLSSSFLHRKSHSLNALQLNHSEKGVKQHIWEQLQSFQKKQGVQLSACWEVPGEKWGPEGHLSAKGSAEKARFPAIGLRGQRGEEGRKAVIYLFTTCVCKTASPTVMQKKGRGALKINKQERKVLLN